MDTDPTATAPSDCPARGKLGLRTLDELIAELHNAFEGEVVDVDYVKALLATYKSNPRDWKKFAFFDPHRYTRNLVDTGNGKFNLMALCWGEGHGSSIHSHSDAHCFVKVLHGHLKETLYAWPPASSSEEADRSSPSPLGAAEQPLQQTNVNIYDKDGVTYINDDIGLHRMENPSHTEGAVSLHLYSPPFGSCVTYDEKTGHKRVVKMTFTSVKGARTPVGQQQNVNECSQYCAATPSPPPSPANVKAVADADNKA